MKNETKKINVTCWFKVIESEVITDGVTFDNEVTAEQYARIEKSFQSGKFEYMNDDKTLADIVELFIPDADQDGINCYGEVYKQLTPVFEYPVEVTGKALPKVGEA